jgi:cell division protein FtsW (lipid II flippase)
MAVPIVNVRTPHAPPAVETPPDQPAGRRSPILDLLFPLPAVAVGVLVMRASGIPATAWGQNLAACVVGLLLCFILARPRPSHRGDAGLLVAGVLALGFLAATWLDPGLQGVHRWLRLGPVRLHAGALVLPLVLATLAGLERAGRRGASTLLSIATALVLVLQPDAAQATAFVAGCVVLLLPRRPAEGHAWLRLVPLLALAGLSWLRKDPLAPVPHVEGIVGLAMELGTGWGAAAVASLLLLPVPFFAARKPGDDRAGLAIGTYVAVTILAAALGHFPVPVLGQGASPIIGYFAAIGLLRRSRRSEARVGATPGDDPAAARGSTHP